VAPAELEGCLLTHADVTNACVVGVPDDYSMPIHRLSPILLTYLCILGGEVALAFIVLTPDAARRIEQDPGAAARIKASIAKVWVTVDIGHCPLG
jgi:acyl-CoA synthetase (AMP-forming)/AMP-acid ligase II